MAERLIRIGKVSSINKKKGMISVTYPDLDNSTTGEFPVFSFTDEYKMPSVGAEVLVLHLSNGQSAGIVLGRFWNELNIPPIASGFRKEMGDAYGESYMGYNNGELVIHADKIVIDGAKIILKGNTEVPDDYYLANGDIKFKEHTHTDSMNKKTTNAEP